MSTIELGYDPYDLDVRLSWGGGWYVKLTLKPTAELPDGFAVGTQVFLEWHVTTDSTIAPLFTWPAVISGGLATFEQSPATVQAVLTSIAKIARLHYVDPVGREYVWGGGKWRKV